jgi:hypothetical protein
MEANSGFGFHMLGGGGWYGQWKRRLMDNGALNLYIDVDIRSG